MAANTLERIFSVDYKSKIQPIVSVCKRGEELEYLNGPEGVTIDNSTGYIYVADCLNNCVKVFDCNAKIMFKFGDEEGEGKMCHPVGKGKRGKGDLEFDYPRGLTFDESNGEVYICDPRNHRIQIMSQELTFKAQFGQDNLKSPIDVNLTKEFIYILDLSDPCLHLYDYNLILHKSVISIGCNNLQVIIHCSFHIDNSNNVLITNNFSNTISILNSQLELIHRIPITHANGFTVDNRGRVIVVCNRGEHHLIIFDNFLFY
ncbi:RING finger protein nhl-1 isoform X1 [Oopsacas minuta]|uniref:RING finger protein nhl-1 isoform X1 n=1 Tax=Oopsacas minuta TaxID=111878 RepID=A0AAV7JFU0_9METZ|nr:RING finger protein nhl-1 isoform X1 [Oopsacas minuta]